MACGAKYTAMVRTSSGYTPEKLWPGFFGLDVPTTDDYQEWEAVAFRLRNEAYRRLEELGEVETSRKPGLKPGDMVYPRYTAMRDIYEPLNAQVNELKDQYSLSSLWESDTLPTSFTTGVQKASQLAIELACLIEQIDGESAKYGVPPRVISDTAVDTEKSLGLIGSALLLGCSLAFIGGTIYVAKKLQ